MKWKGWSGWVCAAAVALLCGLESRASAAPGARTDEDPDAELAVLYTIGPGATLFERWGHSLLCFQPRGAFARDGALESPDVPDTPALVDTSCFDFGVFPRDPISRVVSGSMRGEALFVPREIAYQTAVGRYFWLDRTISRQVLPLSHEQVFDLRDRFNQIVLEERGYPYHPFSNNCSSQLRDALDEFSGGKLREEEGNWRGPSLRTSAEEGFSGQALSLMGLELLVGASADVPTTAWQRAAFPEGLKLLVEDRLGARSHQVYKQSWTPLPTSVHAGRGLMLFLAALLCAVLVWAAKKRGAGSLPHTDGSETNHSREAQQSVAWQRSVQTFGFLIAAVGSLSIALRFYSAYPEFKSSWTPLIFFPLDAALPWMKSKVRRRYLGVRLSCIALLALLSLSHLLAQPLVTMALFVALPMTILGFFESQRDLPEADSAPDARGVRETA